MSNDVKVSSALVGAFEGNRLEYLFCYTLQMKHVGTLLLENFDDPDKVRALMKNNTRNLGFVRNTNGAEMKFAVAPDSDTVMPYVLEFQSADEFLYLGSIFNAVDGLFTYLFQSPDPSLGLGSEVGPGWFYLDKNEQEHQLRPLMQQLLMRGL